MHDALQRHERTRAEAHDAQMRNESVTALGALAAGYAHELSSPLATMAVVVAELKREHAADAKLSKDLKVIDDQLQASKQIVSNLTGAGGQRRAEAATRARLDDFIRSIVERARVRHPGAKIVASLDRATAPPWIVAEETLRQAITNLIDNAVQASPLHAEVHADWSGAELRVTVQDRGTGFNTERLRRVGKCAVATKSAAGGGMGLGLLLSAATLERLGGSLELTNQPNGGARCEICVPLRAIAIQPTGSSDHTAPSV
jgi:two-component system sensor histidine kinase RegB